MAHKLLQLLAVANLLQVGHAQVAPLNAFFSIGHHGAFAIGVERSDPSVAQCTMRWGNGQGLSNSAPQPLVNTTYIQQSSTLICGITEISGSYHNRGTCMQSLFVDGSSDVLERIHSAMSDHGTFVTNPVNTAPSGENYFDFWIWNSINIDWDFDVHDSFVCFGWWVFGLGERAKYCFGHGLPPTPRKDLGSNNGLKTVGAISSLSKDFTSSLCPSSHQTLNSIRIGIHSTCILCRHLIPTDDDDYGSWDDNWICAYRELDHDTPYFEKPDNTFLGSSGPAPENPNTVKERTVFDLVNPSPWNGGVSDSDTLSGYIRFYGKKFPIVLAGDRNIPEYSLAANNFYTEEPHFGTTPYLIDSSPVRCALGGNICCYVTFHLGNNTRNLICKGNPAIGAPTTWTKVNDKYVYGETFGSKAVGRDLFDMGWDSVCWKEKHAADNMDLFCLGSNQYKLVSPNTNAAFVSVATKVFNFKSACNAVNATFQTAPNLPPGTSTIDPEWRGETASAERRPASGHGVRGVHLAEMIDLACANENTVGVHQPAGRHLLAAWTCTEAKHMYAGLSGVCAEIALWQGGATTGVCGVYNDVRAIVASDHCPNANVWSAHSCDVACSGGSGIKAPPDMPRSDACTSMQEVVLVDRTPTQADYTHARVHAAWRVTTSIPLATPADELALTIHVLHTRIAVLYGVPFEAVRLIEVVGSRHLLSGTWVFRVEVLSENASRNKERFPSDASVASAVAEAIASATGQEFDTASVSVMREIESGDGGDDANGSTLLVLTIALSVLTVGALLLNRSPTGGRYSQRSRYSNRGRYSERGDEESFL